MIAYYAHHHGSGHRHRATAIARCAGVPVIGLSSGPEPQDWPGAWVALPDDAADVDPARDDVTARGHLHWVPVDNPGHRARMHAIGSVLASGEVALLVSDVSVEVSLLARLHGVPVVAVAQPGDRRDPAHLLGYGIASALLAPWPRRSAPGWPRDWQDKALHVGGFSRFDGRPRTAPSGGRSVLLLWGSGGIDVDPDGIRAAAAATPGWRWRVAGPRVPATEGDPANLTWLGWVADPWRELVDAAVVVTHAGQNAVAEVAAARRPAVVIPQRRPFDEQHATAGALAAARLCAVAPAWPAAADWAGALDEAERVGGDGWSAWSDGQGAQRAAAELTALARR
ncbi:glycosyltransferase [Actinokineospora bangkokensis]|uniref:Glycosyl transferase family 28 C-terminal domain-containing protein n=1 Tax=Actinokineospora bangkokensis TaxID=1193682 RepID=A0A1Q9LMM7_9PSEU|nr:glycosyltransferase [Actinokineospora bangkokensis]OLR93265.1 hypothetical protein BJP25_17430 [Actinokineospora bangkokensis]